MKLMEFIKSLETIDLVLIIMAVISVMMLIASEVKSADFHSQGKWAPSPVITKQVQDGKPINNIMRDKMLWQGVNPVDMVATFYCLDVDTFEIIEAAESNGINPESISQGFDKGINECEVDGSIPASKDR